MKDLYYKNDRETIFLELKKIEEELKSLSNENYIEKDFSSLLEMSKLQIKDN